MENLNPKISWATLVIFASLSLVLVGYGSYKYYQDVSDYSIAITSITVPKQSQSPKSTYICPQSEWLDCMPQVAETPTAEKKECQIDYLDWAKKNCPNFKGVAY